MALSLRETAVSGRSLPWGGELAWKGFYSPSQQISRTAALGSLRGGAVIGRRAVKTPSGWQEMRWPTRRNGCEAGRLPSSAEKKVSSFECASAPPMSAEVPRDVSCWLRVCGENHGMVPSGAEDCPGSQLCAIPFPSSYLSPKLRLRGVTPLSPPQVLSAVCTS
jgi:hypothetical protein